MGGGEKTPVFKELLTEQSERQKAFVLFFFFFFFFFCGALIISGVVGQKVLFRTD